VALVEDVDSASFPGISVADEPQNLQNSPTAILENFAPTPALSAPTLQNYHAKRKGGFSAYTLHPVTPGVIACGPFPAHTGKYTPFSHLRYRRKPLCA
jgi:hypothetical protein